MRLGYASAKVAPTSDRIVLRGLGFRVLQWQPEVPSGLTVLMLHGFADTASSFDLLAPLLAARGHRVVAPDHRGFGDTDRIPASGYYHFPDYVADVDALVRVLAPSRLAVVGHSMGGTIAALYAGSRPQRVERLALLEGFGPPAQEPADAPMRFTTWLDDLAATEQKPRERSFASLDEGYTRLAVQHHEVDRSILRQRVAELAKENPDGRYSWRMDPLHRTTSPIPFSVDVFCAFLGRVMCPTLVVSGGEHGYHPADEAKRIAALRESRVLELPNAGHMMHWTAAKELGDALGAFLDGR